MAESMFFLKPVNFFAEKMVISLLYMEKVVKRLPAVVGILIFQILLLLILIKMASC
jgi:hypothetical protein